MNNVKKGEKFERLKEIWQNEMQRLGKSGVMKKLATGDVTLEQYKNYLRETYYQAGSNPQLQAYATAFFPQSQRAIVKKFYQHAISEIGHDLMALHDYKTLGGDADAVLKGNPLPETLATTAFAYYQIQFRNPVGYLGYLFHLEFLPTQNGRNYIELLKKKGVPESALTFLEEHATVDIAHNKLMEVYVEDLIQTQEDFDEVVFALKTMCKLHVNLLAAVFDSNV